jgi:nuclease S1
MRDLAMAASYVAVATALLGAAPSRAEAWGCEGHQAIVFIAERVLPPATLAAARATLMAAPIDPALRRFCGQVPDDPLADSATWADDSRDIDSSTFGWHFIDVPRGTQLTIANEHGFCPGGDCVVEAIATQFALVKSEDPVVKAKALRFLLHLIGDLHQPLHTTTNGDRGGNCVPVSYHDRPPQQTPIGDFSPNLHSVWDTLSIRTLMTTHRLADARALAGYVTALLPLPADVAPEVPTRARVTTWAESSHALAGRVAYGGLTPTIPLEPASAARIGSCHDNRDVVRRMLARQETIDASYERTSIPIIVSQLRLAGVRLAAVLKAAYQ